ncbi:MAG: hypothetical protein QOE14_1308, partial [Humisphaera sp.]|nr:hypothetical protein [Humisphaera sp.]
MSSLRFDRHHNIFDLQPLEVRRFFTTAVVGLNNTLEILGTASAETITVNRNTAGRITVSGVATQFTVGSGAGQINKILIQAAAGNDTVLLTNNVRVPATGVGIPATIAGNAGHDSITGGPGNDIINGNDGNDMMDGGGGNDEFTGGANFDTANYSTRTGAIVVTIGVGANDGEVAAAEADNVTATVEEVIGGAGNDTITGSGNADYIAGGGGNDSMTGGNGGDQLTGSAGQDKFFGQSGDDFLLAQNSDQDTVNGGTNADLTPDLDLASVDPIDIPARGALNFLIAAAEGSPSALDPTYSPDDGIAELTPVDYNPLTGVDGQGRVAFLYDQYGQNGGNGYGYDVVARRLDADGNIDDGFGAVVIDTTEAADVGQGYNVDDTRMGVAFGADGSMFVLIARSRLEGNRGFAVAKLTPAGALDTSYGGGDGIAVFEGASLTGVNDFMTAIAVQDDGKVVVAGSVYEISQGGDQDFLVARLTTTGLLDNTANGGAGNFNGAGFRQVDLANAVSDMEWTNDIAFQKIAGDGAAQRIVIAGATESGGRQGALIRFTAAGALDPSFGTGGSRSYLVGDVTEIKRIAINAANEIFLLGNETTIPIIGKGITVSSPTGGAGTFDFVAKLNVDANDAGQVNLDSANLNDVTTDAQGRAIAVG